MRPLPASMQAAPLYSGAAASSISIRLNLQITTAFYGGGVEAGVSDAAVPFRPSAIRGLLRWFWRATRGAQFATFKELKQREDAIWGSTTDASKVVVDVTNARLGAGKLALRRENNRKVFEQPSYVLFPAQSVTPRYIHTGGSFDLHISFPKALLQDISDDIDAALHYWINFGGVGARTRRGMGALYCNTYSGPDRWYRPDLLLGAGAQRPWSTCKGARAVAGQPMPHQQAWLASARILQEFSQWRTGPRGRSLWPEPDALRRLRSQSAPTHREPMTSVDIFPRAALGLPKIFQFKTPGDPSPDNTLVIDAQTDRFPSPVIVKPLAISATHSIPILIALNTPPPPAKLLLTRKGGPDLPVDLGDPALVINSLLNSAATTWNAPVYTL